MALASNALTNVATVEDELSIASGTEDARLQRMINIASDTAESYAGRIFYRDTAIAEKVRAGDGPFLFVSRPPINSITSITFLGDTIDSDDYEIRDDGKNGIIDSTTGSWPNVSVMYQDINRTIAHGNERKTITVTYDGGWYTQPQDDADGDITRNLPYDIEYACIAIVAYLRRSMGKDPSITSESLLGSSQTFANVGGRYGSGDWIESSVPAAASILNRYKLPVLR